MDTQNTQNPQSNRADNSTLYGVLAYLGILIIIPFLMAKDNPKVKFHIKQGAVLVVIEIAVWILGTVSWHLWPFLSLVNLGTLILSIIGIVNVVQNKEKELPIVGQFSKHFTF